jgi:hypothetical protein
MATIFQYLRSIWPYWPAIVSAGGFWGLEAALHAYWPRAKRLLDKIPPSTRRAINVGLLFLAVFYSGFSAWSDEHEARIRAEHVSQPTPIRCLTQEQRERMKSILLSAPTETHFLMVASMPNCDECAQFADDIRTFFNSVPGWKADEPPIIFSEPPPHKRGIYLLMSDDEKIPAGKISMSFEAAGMSITAETDKGFQRGTLTILIGRDGSK